MTCAYCQGPMTFNPERPNQKYCSILCRRKVDAIKQAEVARQRTLAAIQPRPCPICSTVYEPGKRNAMYCSRTCNGRAYERRKSERTQAVLTDTTCIGCGVTFKARNSLHVYCTQRCGARTKDRIKAEARRVATPPLICIDCPMPVEENRRKGGATRCKPCAIARKKIQDQAIHRAQDLARKQAAEAARPQGTCPECATVFVKKTKNQKYCTLQCQRKVSARRTTERVREQRARDVTPRVARERRPPKPTALVKRTPPKLAPITPKKEKDKGIPPNLEGDWFPGWDGCWSPNISALGRELIEKHIGPAPTPESLKRAS